MKLLNNKLVKEMSKHGGEIVRYVSKNSPTILTGCAVAGVFVVAGLTAKAMKPALEHIKEAKKAHRDRIVIQNGDTRENYELTDAEIESVPLKTTEVIGAVWKDFIPTGIALAGTTACIIGAHSISAKRTAAMAALYTMSEQALKDYKAKTEEIVGKGKAEKIRDAVAEEQLKQHPVDAQGVIDTGTGNTLMFDPLTSRYFRGDIETIRRIVNDLDAQCVAGMESVSQNEYYYAIGLDGIATGDEAGWSLDNRIELRLTSGLTSNAQPCLVLGFVNNPVPWYQNC